MDGQQQNDLWNGGGRVEPFSSINCHTIVAPTVEWPGVVLCVVVAAGESCGGTTTTAGLLFNDIVLIVGLPVLECFVN